ncbi:MAG: imidazole glycerol phosphate synthase subunit HisF [Clostridia bacterium]|nr:imidazole glycerol phosphate synthase subunit HisF [Clostridia bacterium]
MKKIIPCLDIKNNRVTKGINFIDLIDAGDIVENACRYAREGADELVMLDITATTDSRSNELLEKLSEVTTKINIPITVGGGISSITQIEKTLKAGATSVGINSPAIENPSLLKEAAEKFGKKAICSAIDVQYNGTFYEVFTHGGQISTGLEVTKWAKEVESLGAGSILLTSISDDGKKDGYDIAVTKLVADTVSIPVIASGGAGKKEDFLKVFQKTKAESALAASVFHFGEINIRELKLYLKENGIGVNL